MARCRSCGDEIDFVTLRSGKRMPVESTTAETYYVHLGQGGHPQVVLVLDSGDIVRGRLGKQHESGALRVEGRESHFANCPAADEFRRRIQAVLRDLSPALAAPRGLGQSWRPPNVCSRKRKAR